MKNFLLFLLALPLAAGTVRIYVTNSAGDSISIIDPAVNKVVGEWKVSMNPHGIVPSPDRSRFYISSEGENLMDVLDRKSGKVIKKIPLGTRPNNVAITPDGKRVYVCIRQESWVDVVDTATLTKAKSIPVGANPHNVYCTPDGRYMLATSMGEHKITAIDIRTEKPAFTIPVGGIPRPVAIEAGKDGVPKRLFVQLSNLHGFEIVDYATRKVTGKVQLPAAPPDAKPLIPFTFSHGMAIAPDEKSLWVDSLLNNAVYVYSLPDLRLLASIPVGHGPDWMTFTPDGKRCYVSNAGSDSVSVLDAIKHKEIVRIPVGKTPKRLIAVALPD
jgi:YVTN family beta-propeller protein